LAFALATLLEFQAYSWFVRVGNFEDCINDVMTKILWISDVFSSPYYSQWVGISIMEIVSPSSPKTHWLCYSAHDEHVQVCLKLLYIIIQATLAIPSIQKSHCPASPTQGISIHQNPPLLYFQGVTPLVFSKCHKI